MDLREMMKTLSRLDAPSGFEAPAAECAAQLLRPYVDEISIDALGSVTAVRRGLCSEDLSATRSNRVIRAQRVLLDAHLDEVGFIITGHTDGFLRFAPLGGIDARLLPAMTIKILSETQVYGVIDVLPPHLLSGDDAEKAQKIDDLYIDTGYTQEEAERLVPVGTPAVYASEPLELGENKLAGKAFDDRACFAAIIRALELLGDTRLDFDLYILASSQEELGRRGAMPAAFSAEPDYCIILDVDHAKTPDSKPHQGKPLGSGVVIARGPNMNRELTDKLISLAKAEEIAHTISVEPGDSGTNARVIQTVRSGVCTALLGVPLRYMHSPNELLDLNDIEATAQLVCAALKGGVFER